MKLKMVKKSLALLLTSALPCVAHAKSHRDYTSVGAVTSANLLNNEVKPTSGVDIGRRLPLFQNVGLLFGYAGELGYTKKVLKNLVFRVKLDLSVDEVRDDIEILLGPGLFVKDYLAYFAPHAGLRFHFKDKNGPYVSAEIGIITDFEKVNGGYIQLGAGYRFDSSLK